MIITICVWLRELHAFEPSKRFQLSSADFQEYGPKNVT